MHASRQTLQEPQSGQFQDKDPGRTSRPESDRDERGAWQGGRTSRHEARFSTGRRARPDDRSELPHLLTVDDTAVLLRTTRKAVYAMLDRGQLPTPHRIGRRLLLRQDELLHWLDQKRASSLKE